MQIWQEDGTDHIQICSQLHASCNQAGSLSHKEIYFHFKWKDELCFHTKNEACRLLCYLIVLVDVYSLGSVEISCSEVLDSVVCWDPLLAIVCSQHVGLSYKCCEILGWEKRSGVTTRSTSAFDRNSTIFGGQDACHFDRTYTTDKHYQ